MGRILTCFARRWPCEIVLRDSGKIRRMRTIGFVVVLAAACGGGSGGGDIWDVRMARFAEAFCVNSCVPADSQEICVQQVQSDMDQARFVIGTEGEAACLACVQVKTDLMAQIVANNCEASAAVAAMISGACDTDDRSDFDGDGDPGNDQTEACAGFPFGGIVVDDPPPPPPME
jgi:hypothetical protein